MTKSQKIIFAILIVIILAAAGYFAYKYYFKPQYHQMPASNYPTPTTSITPKVSPKINLSPSKPQTVIISGYKLYKNTDFGFEIQYPEKWTVSEEDIVNVRGENTKAFYFKKPNSDLRFAILPRDGLSYGLSGSGTSTVVIIGGSIGSQNKYTLPDGRRLWLVYPNHSFNNWSYDIGRIDILSSATDPVGDTRFFEVMLNSFKFMNL